MIELLQTEPGEQFLWRLAVYILVAGFLTILAKWVYDLYSKWSKKRKVRQALYTEIKTLDWPDNYWIEFDEENPSEEETSPKKLTHTSVHSSVYSSHLQDLGLLTKKEIDRVVRYYDKRNILKEQLKKFNNFEQLRRQRDLTQNINTKTLPNMSRFKWEALVALQERKLVNRLRRRNIVGRVVDFVTQRSVTRPVVLDVEATEEQRDSSEPSTDEIYYSEKGESICAICVSKHEDSRSGVETATDGGNLDHEVALSVSRYDTVSIDGVTNELLLIREASGCTHDITGWKVRTGDGELIHKFDEHSKLRPYGLITVCANRGQNTRSRRYISDGTSVGTGIEETIQIKHGDRLVWGD